MDCNVEPDPIACELSRINDALNAGPSWFEWLNFGVAAATLLATILIGVVALVATARIADRDREERRRPERLELVADLREYAIRRKLSLTRRDNSGHWIDDDLQLMKDQNELMRRAELLGEPNALEVAQALTLLIGRDGQNGRHDDEWLLRLFGEAKRWAEDPRKFTPPAPTPSLETPPPPRSDPEPPAA